MDRQTALFSEQYEKRLRRYVASLRGGVQRDAAYRPRRE
jgi:hypothetical protein